MARSAAMREHIETPEPAAVGRDILFIERAGQPGHKNMPENGYETEPFDGKNLTVPMKMFLSARVGTVTDADAARQVGLHAKTPSVWKANIPEFKAEYDKLGENALESARRQLQSTLNKAILVLEDCLDDDLPRNRLKAAELIAAYAGLTRGQDINVNTRDKANALLAELVADKDDDAT